MRGRPLQESTKRGYLIWLRKYVLPTFGEMPLDTITAADVVRWYEQLPHDKGKTVRECYALAKAIMKSATAADGVLPGAVNPFTIDGAGTIGTRADKRTEVIEDADLDLILATIRPEWRAMIALALGCGLRFGEIVALRRSDVDLRARPPVVRVRRAIGTGTGGKRYEKEPSREPASATSASLKVWARPSRSTCGAVSTAATDCSFPVRPATGCSRRGSETW